MKNPKKMDKQDLGDLIDRHCMGFLAGGIVPRRGGYEQEVREYVIVSEFDERVDSENLEERTHKVLSRAAV